MKTVVLSGLPANHPDHAPIKRLLEGMVALTDGVNANVAASSLLTLYRQVLLDHPTLQAQGIRHLVRISDELQAQGAAPAEQSPAVAPAVPTGLVAIPLDGLDPRAVEVVQSLARFITSQGWHHAQVLPALLFLLVHVAKAHPFCLATSADVLQEASELLRVHKQSLPEAEQAGHAIH